MVRAIVSKMASVYLYDNGQEVDVSTRYIEPVSPNKSDKVKSIGSSCFCVFVFTCTCMIFNAYAYAHTRTRTHTHTQVKGIRGPNRDLIGTLINIDEGDGIVKLDADSALKIISLDILGKYVPKY